MSTFLVIALVAVLVGIGLVFVPLRVRFSLQGRGEPSGFWALAGGVQLGPIAASGLAAQGIPATLTLHVIGKKLWQKKLAELGASKEKEAEPEEREKKPLGQRYRKLERWLDPFDLGLFLLRERRRVELLPTEVDLEYGFRDIATTGKLLAAICAISPLLPGPLIVRQRPSGGA